MEIDIETQGTSTLERVVVSQQRRLREVKRSIVYTYLRQTQIDRLIMEMEIERRGTSTLESVVVLQQRWLREVKTQHCIPTYSIGVHVFL